jgi:hypothetical protein
MRHVTIDARPPSSSGKSAPPRLLMLALLLVAILGPLRSTFGRTLRSAFPPPAYEQAT